ncbi:hypothetical protein [Mycoplasma seminis]|uniref:DUF4231 domain-containing protein n=1 Tax=Mycoplasma seminis TaxID=512749 RepID=A0ABY9HB15_9MOLU|nr:hypothetical protein [Mycoplasma seminis]WLP85794.1 hypothetical protein Q8852_01450 [Mycoplasma seminis]
MNQVIEILKNKLKKDEKRLKRYKLLDDIFSVLIALLNISAIVLASIVLSKLIKIDNKPNTTDRVNYESYLLVALLASFIIISFFLNLFIAIYRYNTHSDLYKKIYNTICYIQIKYDNGQISQQAMNNIIDALFQQASTRKKIVIAEVLKNELTTGSR